MEHALVAARVKLEVERARKGFEDESHVLEREHAAAMEDEYR
jgi:hypothetical protein